MRATLTPSWELSTEHAASSRGRPVLVHRSTGEVLGPGDLVQVDPGEGFVSAAAAVHRLAQTATLDAEGRELAERFVSVPA